MLKVRHLTLSLLTLMLIVGCGDKEKSGENSDKVVKEGSIKITKNAISTTTKKDNSKENSGQFYYSYNKENGKNEDKSEENNVSYRTTMDAYLHIRSPYERIKISLMINKLSHDFIVNCSACHDDYGNGIIGPSLLGKNGDFIYKQLMDFKSGKRKNVLMKGLVSQIDDKKLKSIANEIADFNEKLLKLRNRK